MPIDVKFDAPAQENRQFSGKCGSCGSTMTWLASDAARIVETDGLKPTVSFVSCPVVADGKICGAEVEGRLM